MPLVDKLAFGGETRQQSVLNGLLALPEGIDLVAIHDAARAFVPLEVIQKAVADAERFGSGVASTWLVDTVKFVDEENRALSTPRRAQMRAVQTPQVFRFSSILCPSAAALDGFSATDDATIGTLWRTRTPLGDEGRDGQQEAHDPEDFQDGKQLWSLDRPWL